MQSWCNLSWPKMRWICLPVCQRPVSLLLMERKKGSDFESDTKTAVHDTSAEETQHSRGLKHFITSLSYLFSFFSSLCDKAQMKKDSQYLHGWFPTDSIPHTGPLTFLLAEFVKWMSRQRCPTKDCSVAVWYYPHPPKHLLWQAPRYIKIYIYMHIIFYYPFWILHKLDLLNRSKGWVSVPAGRASWVGDLSAGTPAL